MMSRRVAVDTSVLVGVMNPMDVWHDKAKALFDYIGQTEDELVIFDCVLAECISVICRRLHEKKRPLQLHAFFEAVESQFPVEKISWILPDVPVLYTAVLTLMKQTGGQLNFNDALIALACQKEAIEQIATFDADFDLIPWLNRVGTGS